MDQSFPYMDGSLSDMNNAVLSNEVQRCQYSVATFLAKDLSEYFAGGFSDCRSGFFVFFQLSLAANPGKAEEKLANEGDGRLLRRIQPRRNQILVKERTRIRQPGSNIPRSNSGSNRSTALFE